MAVPNQKANKLDYSHSWKYPTHFLDLGQLNDSRLNITGKRSSKRISPG